MKYSEWEQLDKAFKEKLFDAYHAWRHSKLHPEYAEHAVILLDKRMQEAYDIRESYINVTTFSEI